MLVLDITEPLVGAAIHGGFARVQIRNPVARRIPVIEQQAGEQNVLVAQVYLVVQQIVEAPAYGRILAGGELRHGGADVLQLGGIEKPGAPFFPWAGNVAARSPTGNPQALTDIDAGKHVGGRVLELVAAGPRMRSEEHTSELQSPM